MTKTEAMHNMYKSLVFGSHSATSGSFFKLMKITNEQSFNMNFLSMSSISLMGDKKVVGTVNKIISNLFHVGIHVAWNLKPEVGAITVRTLI